jgi:hypothetical protein
MVTYDGQDRRQTRTIFVQIPMSQWRMGIAVMSPTVMLLGALLGVKTFEARPLPGGCWFVRLPLDLRHHRAHV